jgi:hypothetical protein
MPDDIVRDFMRRYRKRHPDLSVDQLRQFETECRQAWGGTRIYVCKDPAEGKAFRLAQSLAAGRSLFEAAPAIPRSTRYRLLLRKWVISY